MVKKNSFLSVLSPYRLANFFYTLTVITVFFVTLSPSLAQDSNTKNNPIKVAIVTDLYPLSEFDNKGNFSGIIADYLRLASNKTKLSFDVVSIDTKEQAIKLLREHKIDAIIADINDQQISPHAKVSSPFFSNPVLAIGSKESQKIQSLYELGNQRIAYLSGSGYLNQIKLRYPQLNLTPVNSIKDVLIGVETGKYTASLSSELIAIQNLDYHGIQGLTALAETGVDLLIGFYVSPNRPQLFQQLDTFATGLTKREVSQIQARWGSGHFIKKVDYTYAIIVALFSSLIVALLWFWTKRLKQEVILRKQAELRSEQANLLKSQFLANMSHEVRTPMNAIIGFSDLLKKTQLNSKQHRYAEAVETSAKSLLAIINDILDLSKIEAGMLKIENEKFNIHKLFNDLKLIFTHSVQQKKLFFDIEFSPDFPEIIIGDEVRLRQVLTNLLSNSVKFTSEGGIKLSATFNNSNLHICVQDTGMGIPLEQQAKIFEAFVQQEGQTASDFEGTGLGLSISIKLAKLMQGELTLKSDGKNQGSTFCLSLNHVTACVSDAIKTEIQTEYDNVRFNHQTVLIVDDKLLNRVLLKELLQPLNLQVLEAENGLKALQAMESKNISLVLSDIRMPEMDGHEMIATIKQNQAYDELPIFAVTASVMKEEQQALLKEGFNEVLSKPIDVKSLNRLLSNYLNKKATPFILDKTINSNDLNLLTIEILQEIKQKGYPLLNSSKISELEKFKSVCEKIVNENEAEADVQNLETYLHQLSEALQDFDMDAIEMNKERMLKILEQI